MQIITLVPMFLSIYFICRYSVERAFTHSYIPALTLLPAAYLLEIKGLPEVSFQIAAFLPVAFVTFMTRLRRYRPIILDALVVAFAVWEVCSEYNISGMWAAQSQFVFSSLTLVGPYLCARLLVGSKKLPVERFVKILTFCLFLNVVAMLHSVVFGFSLYERLFRYLFPGTHHGEWFQHRFGLPRLQGAFVHPILAGLAFVIALQFHYWLTRNRAWEARFRSSWLRWGRKATLITGSLLIMLFLTLSRAPWLAAAYGLFIVSVTRKKRVRTALLVRVVAMSICLVIGYRFIKWYSTQGDQTALQASVHYRWVLGERFKHFLSDRPLYGWGAVNWPIEHKFHKASVDNAYLYYGIKRGYPGLYLFALLLGWQCFWSLQKALTRSADGRSRASLEVVLFSVHSLLAISLVTVWIDPHLLQLYMVISGMSGTFLSKSRHRWLRESASVEPAATPATARLLTCTR